MLLVAASVGVTAGAAPPSDVRTTAPAPASSASAPPLASALAAPPSRPPSSPVPSDTRQLLVVRAPRWTSVRATLRRYERTTDGWALVGSPIAVNLGRHGLGWGRGLQGEPASGPVKKEGDAKAPAGVFALGPAFGYDDKPAANDNSYPYVYLHKRMSCIEDARSPYYNQVLDFDDAPGVKREHRSDMRRPDGLFRTGLIVRQNREPAVPGGGSCVFMHIWRGPGQGTAGCTAMPSTDIEQIVTWLRADFPPVLVQLPEVEYERVKSSWGLPD